jgi:hypothetical protein
MTNFKVGDKVKITGNTNHSCNKVGDIGLITEIDPMVGDLRVNVDCRDNLVNWTKSHEMELVTTPDVPIGYVGLPKDMNLKDGDKIKGVKSGDTYVVADGEVGCVLISRCAANYTLVSRASEWAFTDNPDYTTHDVASHNGVAVAARKKAPVVRTIDVSIYTDEAYTFVKRGTVQKTDDVVDWSTLTVD